MDYLRPISEQSKTHQLTIMRNNTRSYRKKPFQRNYCNTICGPLKMAPCHLNALPDQLEIKGPHQLLLANWSPTISVSWTRVPLEGANPLFWQPPLRGHPMWSTTTYSVPVSFHRLQLPGRILIRDTPGISRALNRTWWRYEFLLFPTRVLAAAPPTFFTHPCK